MSSRKNYADFELELEYRLPPGGNSGIFLRAWPGGPLNGAQFLEIQLLDGAAHPGAGGTTLTGAVYGTVAPNPPPKAPTGEWNKVQMRAEGRRVRVAFNGTKVIDVDLDDYPDNFGRFPGLTRGSGRIGLQMLGSSIEFRGVRVRPLK